MGSERIVPLDLEIRAIEHNRLGQARINQVLWVRTEFPVWLDLE